MCIEGGGAERERELRRDRGSVHVPSVCELTCVRVCIDACQCTGMRVCVYVCAHMCVCECVSARARAPTTLVTKVY